ncbi:MAG: hypothetical protein ACI4F4_09940 [Lachnospiraceae bacterium]
MKDDRKERIIKLKLSDEDCESLLNKCGVSGLTVNELLENFIGDLVYGSHCNGSDECMYANQWYDRCGFDTCTMPTLLNHLLSWEYNPEEYLYILDNIETAEIEKKYLQEHPEEANEEARYIDSDIEEWEEELRFMREDWHPEKSFFYPNYKVDMEKEIDTIKKWVKERNQLLMNDSLDKAIDRVMEQEQLQTLNQDMGPEL